MEYKLLGRTGLRVSNLCLGTMTFGASSARPGQADEATAHKILDEFVAKKGNFIDTADVYQHGEAETILGNWLKKQPRRDKLIIATKLFYIMRNDDPNCSGLSRHHIMTNIDESLKRLQTDYIDLLYVHAWDNFTDIEDTMRALTDLVRSGKVRYLGASNFKGWQLQKANDVSKYLGLERFCCIQQQYNLLTRDIEWEITDVCREEKIALLPWSPLKGGWLGGKMEKSGPAEGTRVHHVHTKKQVPIQSHPSFDQFNKEQTWNILEACKSIGKKYDKTMPQVAIRWLLQQPNVPSVVIGVKTMEQLESCLGSLDFVISNDDMESLTNTSDVPLPYPYEQVERMNRQRINYI